MSEVSKYEHVWSLPAYRQGSPGERLVQHFLSHTEDSSGALTLNDYGCGAGRAGLALRQRGFDVLMVDFASNCLDEAVRQSLGERLEFRCADLGNLGESVRDSEWAFCCDVLEHIPEDDVNGVLWNIAVRSECAYFNISGRPDGFGPAYIGSPLHLTVQPASYWIRKLGLFWSSIEHHDGIDSDYIFVCRGRYPQIGQMSRTHVAAPPAPEALHLCLTTFYDSKYSSIGDASLQTMQKYCQTFGIPLERPEVSLGKTSALWAKLDVVRALFNKGYQLVFWIDADAAFTRFDADIRSDLNPAFDISLAKHYVDGREVPNTGVFVIRNTSWSRSLLASIASLKSVYARHPWGENAAILHILGYLHLLDSSLPALREDELRHVQWLDIRWNSIPGICESPAPVVQHYAGHSLLSRTLGLYYLAAKANAPGQCPTCQVWLSDPLLEIVGWQNPEEFRWTGRTEATLRIPVQPGQNAVEFEVSSAYPGHYSVEVWLDSLPVGSMEFNNAATRKFSFDLPDTKPGWKTIRIKTPFLWKPSQYLGSKDQRELGIAIRSVRLFRLDQPLGLIVVLARYETIDPRTRLYSSWLATAAGPILCLRDYDLNWEAPPNTNLLITHEHFSQPELTILRRSMEKDIPVLILGDGIAEYRNTWEAAGRVPGQQYQPLVGHKIACLGPSQAELYDSWGNAGRTEVVGYPSFDPMLGRKRRNHRTGPLRLLVMTARNPYFTAEQYALLYHGLSDLKLWLESHSVINGRPVNVIWRLTGGLEAPLKVVNHQKDIYSCPLEEIVAEVDGVITTPSTAMLVPMLMDIPTAVLDYFRCPLYVQAAWRISSKEDLDDAIPSMFANDPIRLKVQTLLLHEALQCDVPAARRLQRLMDVMCGSGRRHRETGQPLSFPWRILNDAGLVSEEVPAPAYRGGDRIALLRREVLQLLWTYDCDTAWLEHNKVERMDAMRTDVSEKTRAEFHLDRYRFASRYVDGKQVLDIACGTGYGTNLLSREGLAARVTGVDISRETVDYARRKYGSDSVEFLCGSAVDIPVPSGLFDVVTSFETLEHIADEGAFLLQLDRALRRQGLLILSTPNDWGIGEVAPFHVRNYVYDTLVHSVGQYFDVESVFEQNSGTPGRTENRGQRRGIVPAIDGNSSHGECFIVIARKRETR